ncbi:procollagen-proline 4-dioxygenase [Aureococcus anophagefferens]|nr:procollagen-proline 4-dioxygenase [Aureococcus anophagefferens]
MGANRRRHAVRPKLFLIEDFCSAAEADALVAASAGLLEPSGTLRNEGVIRVSEHAWLDHAAGDAPSICRASGRRRSPPSFDGPRVRAGADRALRARRPLLPAPGHGRNHGVGRYLTLTLYLNDVDAGGEASFPLADDGSVSFTDGDAEEDDVATMPMGWRDGDPAAPDGEPWDLSREASCRRNVWVRPRKGRAVLWYNHEPISNPDPAKWTELGPLDRCALHGGCDGAPDASGRRRSDQPPGWAPGSLTKARKKRRVATASGARRVPRELPEEHRSTFFSSIQSRTTFRPSFIFVSTFSTARFMLAWGASSTPSWSSR